jgi:hypothetical protein
MKVCPRKNTTDLGELDKNIIMRRSYGEAQKALPPTFDGISNGTYEM